jgi:hypothetical protein
MVDFAEDTQYFDRTYFSNLRRSYISKLGNSGISLIKIAPIWARTKTGMWVAMPAASERQDERWWLGLNDRLIVEKIREGGLAIILLCVTKAEALLDFVLDQRIIIELKPILSRSGDELKFNVRERDQRYALTIPKHRPLDITGYKGRVSILL